jgi:hypothetical protein
MQGDTGLAGLTVQMDLMVLAGATGIQGTKGDTGLAGSDGYKWN